MIKPESLWGLFKSCDNSEWLGTVCRALGGQDVQLDYGQQQMVRTVKLDSGWMDERVEAKREKWRQRQRDKRQRDNGDNGDMSHVTPVTPVTECHVSTNQSNPTIQPTNSNTQSNTNTNGPIGIGVGLAHEGCEQLVRDINRFVAELKADPASGGHVFFSADHDPVVIACAIAGDTGAVRRWRKAVQDLGEDVVRTEMFNFYREIRAGESVASRGAALNKRLTRLAVEGGAK